MSRQFSWRLLFPVGSVWKFNCTLFNRMSIELWNLLERFQRQSNFQEWELQLPIQRWIFQLSTSDKWIFRSSTPDGWKLQLSASDERRFQLSTAHKWIF